MAQIFSDCAITKYLSRATAKQWRPVLTVALLNNPGLQGTPAARRPSPRRSSTTVASLVGQYPSTCSSDSVDRQNDGAPVLCAVACLIVVLTYGEALSDGIISYRIAIFCVISYHIVSCPFDSLMAVSCHHYCSFLNFFYLFDISHLVRAPHRVCIF